MLGLLSAGMCEAAATPGSPGAAGKAAERLLLQGRIDDAVSALQEIVNRNPGDGRAQLLLCRSFYAEESLDEAIGACERAVQAQPGSSEAQDWLGRAYGIKAEHAGPLDGFTLARKVKAAFEAAVELDPQNGDALDDLGEFYADAPSIVGGGQEKAAALAERVEARFPQQAHRMRGLAAEKRKDYGTAEREFKAALDVANRPDAWTDLAGFYRRRKEADKAVDALKHGLALDGVKGSTMVDAASILNAVHREPELAQHLLQQYLPNNAKSDAAPVAKVHVMLGKMLAAEGNTQGAKIEVGKALQLAADYAPAKRALKAL